MHAEVRAAPGPIGRGRAVSGRPSAPTSRALRRVLAVVVGLLAVLAPGTPPAPSVSPAPTVAALTPTAAPAAPTATAATAAPTATAAPAAPEPYELLQLNLCLSGLAGCYEGTAVIDEAVARITALLPEIVTLDEVCSGDVEQIAASTGHSYRFVTVVYGGAPLHCVRPGGRGVFGNAVLAAAPITASQDEPFAAQADLEERRWLCVLTTDDVRACTTHLSVAATPAQSAANAAQCAELTAVLAEGGPHRATVFGGDLNRQDTCAPPGFWTLRDSEAPQSPGVQHAYGSPPSLLPSAARVLPMAHTDHDGLLVQARLVPRAADTAVRPTAVRHGPG